MKTLLSLLLLCIFSLSAHAEDPLSFVAKVYFGDPMMLIPAGSHEAVVAIFSHPNLSKKIEEFGPGDEAIVKGRLIHEARTVEDRVTYHSFMLIDDLRPISLKRLGAIDSMLIPEATYSPRLVKSFEPRGLPVSTEVATTLTLTAASLLLNGLVMGSGQPQIVESINAGVIVFAGTLALGSFIFDPVKERP